MSRRTIGSVLLAAAVLAACSGDGYPAGAPSPTSDLGTPTPTAAATTAAPRPTATPTKTPSASPSFTGAPLRNAGAFLRLVSGEEPVNDPCEANAGLTDLACDDVALAGGGLVWVTGTQDAGGGEPQWVVRIYTFDRGQWVARYSGVDPEGTWRGFRVVPAKLTGFGTDALVVQLAIDSADERRSYDVLTWRKGGPLVLRGHRPDAPRLRVVVRDGYLDEYEQPTAGGRFTQRQLRWNGSALLLGVVGSVPPNRVPPAT
jgi:hypothetical protein